MFEFRQIQSNFWRLGSTSCSPWKSVVFLLVKEQTGGDNADIHVDKLDLSRGSMLK